MNERLFYFFNNLAGSSGFVDSLIIFLASTLPWILFAVVIVYFVFIKKNLNRFLMIVFCVGSSYLVSEFLKWIVFRQPRPFAVLEGVTTLVQASSFNSFPSSHATVFAALATAVFIYDRKKGIIFMIMALLIGLARIAAGVHFPIDILTGWFLGFLITIISYRLFRKLSKVLTNFIS